MFLKVGEEKYAEGQNKKRKRCYFQASMNMLQMLLGLKATISSDNYTLSNVPGINGLFDSSVGASRLSEGAADHSVLLTSLC